MALDLNDPEIEFNDLIYAYQSWVMAVINDEALGGLKLLTIEVVNDELNAMRFLPDAVTSAIKTTLARAYDVDPNQLDALLYPDPKRSSYQPTFRGSLQSSLKHATTSTAPMAQVPHSLEVIQLAKNGHAFQSKDVLQAIVEKEKRRIKDEQMAWRIGGAIIGGLLGIGDGFDVGDVFMSMAFSNLGGLGHQVASREQMEFLEKCKAAWIVSANSPIELASRIGPARSRILAYRGGWQTPLIFNQHQGPRGDYLVPLGLAHQHARGFLQDDSRQAMVNTFEQNDFMILANQLYPAPDSAIRLDSIRKIKKEQAIELDSYADAFTAHAEPVVIEVEGQQSVAYRVPIPVHSDY